MDDTQIKEAYHNLPDLVREIIDGSEWEKSIRNITNKYKLLINQGLLLEDETLLVMLGLSDPKDFVQTISSEADIDPQVAKQIGKDIEDEVFVKIREALQEQTGESADDDFIIEDALKETDESEPVYNKSKLLEINSKIDTKESELPQNPVQDKVLMPKSTTPNIPNANPEANFISRKLSETTVADVTNSDQTLQKPTRDEGMTKTQYSAGIDPYREPVE